jgi:hypothetical protein
MTGKTRKKSTKGNLIFNEQFGETITDFSNDID